MQGEVLEVQRMLAAGRAEDARQSIVDGGLQAMSFNNVGYSLAHYAVANNRPECLRMLASPEIGADLQSPCSVPKRLISAL